MTVALKKKVSLPSLFFHLGNYVHMYSPTKEQLHKFYGPLITSVLLSRYNKEITVVWPGKYGMAYILAVPSL